MATQEAKAWTYTGGYPGTLHQTTIHPSKTAQDSHVLIKIHAAALNPVDIQLMNLPSHKYPWSPTYDTEKGTGCDFAGTVLSSGSTGFSTGDEIYGMTLAASKPNGGAVAEIADFDMATIVAMKKPKSWSFEQAASVPLVYLTAKQCIESITPFVEQSRTKRVAVLGGSSAMGIYSVILAKAKGWKVVTTSSGRNKEFVMGTLGADEHVDYTTTDVRTGVKSFEPVAVIDCVGGTDCIGLPSSKRYTTIVGDKTGRTSMGGPYTYYDYWSPIIAATQWLRWARGQVGLGESYDVVILATKKEWLEEATKILTAEQLFVDSVFPFDEAKKAFERLNTGRAKGKVVVKIA
jgi:NADPH:quinone reductase-like Zn-dependent oxidoreductase